MGLAINTLPKYYKMLSNCLQKLYFLFWAWETLFGFNESIKIYRMFYMQLIKWDREHFKKEEFGLKIKAVTCIYRNKSWRI